MKTSEMIAMLEENPKLRFKHMKWKDGSYITAENNRLFIKNSYMEFEPGYVQEFLKLGTSDWQVVREPVPWQEALQAWAEGKGIKMVFPDGTFNLIKPHFNTEDTCLCISRRNLNTCTWYTLEDTDHA